jgi:hypothetical protein
VRVLKRKILDELEVSGAHYVLCLEYLTKKRVRAAIYHAPRKNLSDRLHCPAIWKQRPHKPSVDPYGYMAWHTPECCLGRKKLYVLATQLIAGARAVFRIKGGWQEHWTEAVCGDQAQDTVSTWRNRALALLNQHVGDRTPSRPNEDEPEQYEMDLRIG